MSRAVNSSSVPYLNGGREQNSFLVGRLQQVGLPGPPPRPVIQARLPTSTRVAGPAGRPAHVGGPPGLGRRQRADGREVRVPAACRPDLVGDTLGSPDWSSPRSRSRRAARRPRALASGATSSSSRDPCPCCRPRLGRADSRRRSAPTRSSRPPPGRDPRPRCRAGTARPRDRPDRGQHRQDSAESWRGSSQFRRRPRAPLRARLVRRRHGRGRDTRPGRPQGSAAGQTAAARAHRGPWRLRQRHRQRESGDRFVRRFRVVRVGLGASGPQRQS